MTQLPNIITLLRIAGSMGLLFCDVMGVAIWIIYGLCGISDLHYSPHDMLVCHPHRHCGRYRHVCRHTRRLRFSESRIKSKH